jgi:hypothetical protein
VPITWVSARWYYASFGALLGDANNSANASIRFGLFADTGGVPSATNYAALNLRDVSTVANSNAVVVAGGSAVANNVQPINGGRPYDAAILCNWGTAGSSKWDIGVLSDDGNYQLLTRGQTTSIGTPAWMGFLLVPPTTNVPCVFEIDYMRDSGGFPLISKV